MQSRLRQQKFRLKKNKIKKVTDQSTNNSEHRLDSHTKITKMKTLKSHCFHCGKKITSSRRASEMSDTVNFNYSFRSFLKARGRLW